MPNGEQFDYDVFISYSHRDSAWIKGELLPGIERAGLRAYVDYRDFTPGMPSLKNMKRGVLKCRNTLLVLAPDYIQSGWCEIENLMAGMLDPANRELRWLPLLRAECGKPLRIATFIPTDAHLELAKLRLSTDRPAARHHAEEALRLATCDGPPDYTYHAAYQEALGLLAQLGER
jgi:hypothetical protein